MNIDFANLQYQYQLYKSEIDEAIQNESAEFDSIESLVKLLKAVKDGSVLKMPFFYDENTQSGELM